MYSLPGSGGCQVAPWDGKRYMIAPPEESTYVVQVLS